PREGQRTGIYKEPVVGRVRVDAAGLVGDHQGDRRVHGGPEKAVHYLPAETYPLLAIRRPDLAVDFVPGSLGENLSGHGLTEDNVCLGDRYRIGTVVLEVSQPRRPCWKIDHRFDTDGLVPLINELGRPGWYFRVLTPGELAAGDTIELVARPAPEFTLSRLLASFASHRPAQDELLLLAGAPALNHDWAERLRRRAAWLGSNTTTD
ncbi:MAG: MOSC domain-containing protein, partial [Bowdeniella nasicola]|nr:MOSC domain-containing protein [Bowdeniella nasicola]